MEIRLENRDLIMPQFDTPINTNDQSVDRVLANPLPVMLILNNNGALNSAINATLEDIARTERGKLLIAKLNTTDNPATAQRFGAHSGIALIAWKSGLAQARLDNPTPDQVRAAADYLLDRGPKPSQPAQPQKNTQTPRPDGHPITVNESNFDQQVLQSQQPVLVDFWAAWCGPCRMIAPTVEALANEYAGKAKVAKVNVDENQTTPTQYNVRGIPTLLLFKGGRVQEQIVGAASRDAIENMIKKHL
jgi:thioredoxin 1